MRLDITFKHVRPVLCPHCGKHVMDETVGVEDSGGRVWYPFLESIGYYVPYDLRTEENDWYGKDMTLTREQTEELYHFVRRNAGSLYGPDPIRELVAYALAEGGTVKVNADW